jgi:dTDP-4-dehydrorhamnose reductase
MRIVITGAGGRLGRAIAGTFEAAGHSVTALKRTDLDVADLDQVADLDRLRPDIIVNGSAYNGVDAAEADAPAAFAVNACAPAFLASAAERLGALLIHYSTDFVFDGQARRPYSEGDQTNPLSVYGASKLAGENEVRARAPRHYILRLESLFGGTGVRGHRPTIDAILDNIVAGLPVRAAVDRTVSPSYLDDVTRATMALVEGAAPYGVYHCVNSGCSTWYDLAREIGRLVGNASHIEPVEAVDLPALARRPQFCALSNRKLASVGVRMPTWNSALARHLTVRRGAVAAALAHF